MSSFQHKIYNYEVTPPVNVWEKINAALNETKTSAEFSSKLYNWETEPPTGSWEKIKSSLNEQGEIIIPRQRKISPLLRYSAVAVFIGLIVFGSLRLLNNRSENKFAEKEKNSSEKNSVTSTESPNKSETKNNNPVTNTIKESNKQSVVVLDKPEKNNYNKTISTITFSQQRNNWNNRKAIQVSLINDETKINSVNRYITLRTPEGNIVRISKKWGDLVCSVSGEEDETDCNNELQKWREKIACSPLAPSSGNFLDIISIVNSLRENNP